MVSIPSLGTSSAIVRAAASVAALWALAACSDTSSGAVAAENTAAACDNGVDDDGDGFTDCADQDCWVMSFCAGGPGADATVGDAETGDDAATGDTTAADADAALLPDAPSGPGCDPCGAGGLKGRVCAPNEQVWVADADVTVTGVGCDGEPFALTARSGPDGVWTLPSVPCGEHTIHVARGSFETTFTATVVAGQVTDLSVSSQKHCFEAAGTPIAVLDGSWDGMHTLLLELGLDFDRYTADGDHAGDLVELLSDPALLAKYRVLFINCGADHGWMPQEHPLVMQNVKDWVLAGGSLYLSDYAWVYGEWAFPDAIEFQRSDSVYDMYTPNSPQLIPGDVTITAQVVDGAMASYLGKSTMQVTFDQGPQIAPSAAGPGTFAHVVGDFPPIHGVGTDFEVEDVPLVLSYVPAAGAGRVIYTNFHNDAQTTADMLTLLNYLVFTL